MSQRLIDVVYFLASLFIENNPDDKVDDCKLWNEIGDRRSVEETTSQVLMEQSQPA